MKNVFANGARIVSLEEDWTHGLTGKIVDDNSAGSMQYVRVDFDPKETAGDGWGYRNSSWYINYNRMKLAEDVLVLGEPEVTTAHFKAGSQSSRILAHLLTGKSITDGECRLVYGPWRLSDIIFKIRKAGFEVNTTIKEDAVGHEYASYNLATKAA